MALRRHLSHIAIYVAVCGLPGVAWLRPHRCDRIQPLWRGPNPPALLPIARSPSRRHRWRRW